MNIFERMNLTYKLNNRISKFNESNLEYLDLNQFYELLSNLNEKQILALYKNKKIQEILNRPLYSKEYEKLSDNSKKVKERIDLILVKNNKKDIQATDMNILEIWEDYLLKNPNNIIYFQNSLTDELKNTLLKVLKENPNFIYQYRNNDNDIISEAFNNENIEIKLPNNNKLHVFDYNTTFYDNANFFKQYIIKYGKDFNNPIHQSVWNKLKNHLYLENFELLDEIFNNDKITNTFIQNLYTEEEYTKILDNCLLKNIKSTTFKRLAEIYGPQQFSYCLRDEMVEIFKELYFIDKNFLINNQDYVPDSIKRLLENKADFLSAYNASKEQSEFTKFCVAINYDFDLKDLQYSTHLGKHDIVIEKCLKDNKLEAIFYYRGSNIELYKMALQNDITLDNKLDYSESQIGFLKYMLKHSNTLNKLQEYGRNLDLIELLFDKNGAKKEFYEYLFLNKRWDILYDIGLEEIKNNFSEKHFIVLNDFQNINTVTLKEMYQTFIIENINNIEPEKITEVKEVLLKLDKTNSSEMARFKDSLAEQLLKLDNPMIKFNEVEQIFIKNNLPTIGKLFSVFKILHPEFSGFNFESKEMSPILQGSNNRKKEIIIFSDLIKCAFGSNNKSVKDYLSNIEQGSDIFNRIKNGETLDNLTDKDKKELIIFRNHLITLYNNSLIDKQNKQEFIITNNVVEDIIKLLYLISPNKTLEYNIKDRLIKMFCHFAGFDTFETAKNYIEQKTKLADQLGRITAEKEFSLEEGDFIKGIGDIKYLNNILQNGSVAKEYLGSSSSSDATPLDTDLSRIMKCGTTIEESISFTEASNYGPIYFVLKNRNNRFVETRQSPLLETKAYDLKKDASKLELFYTGAIGNGHYGIRTGFASSEIDCILCKEYDKRIGIEIVKNGFYIPVFDTNKNLVFSPQDYDYLRSKMNGMTYYGNNEYIFSNKLYSPGVEQILEKLENNYEEVERKRFAINQHIEKVIRSHGLKLKTFIDGDLSEGVVELIDTGSTGRHTNKPGDGDFDFMMRLDKSIISEPQKLTMLKTALENSFVNVENKTKTATGDFRFKGVMIEGLNVPVDIDITFDQKTNKVSYSTDMGLQDRLDLIREKYSDKYNLVIANILLAKSILKEAEVYKPNRGEIPQGGLGGVGIENWILQNGGSFETACEEFLSYAEGKTFEEFKNSYQIWDFGENHISAARGDYLHDNFIARNMSEEGYTKMVAALKAYLHNKNIVEDENYTK